jgi:hypothetical protein
MSPLQYSSYNLVGFLLVLAGIWIGKISKRESELWNLIIMFRDFYQ